MDAIKPGFTEANWKESYPASVTVIHERCATTQEVIDARETERRAELIMERNRDGRHPIG